MPKATIPEKLLQEKWLSKEAAQSKWLVDTNKEVVSAQGAKLAERGFAYETMEKKVSPKRDSNPRPKVYETFALPAELLGQNMAVSAPRYLMLRAKINIAETSFLM
jgi:hypothetical protein